MSGFVRVGDGSEGRGRILSSVAPIARMVCVAIAQRLKILLLFCVSQRWITTAIIPFECSRILFFPTSNVQMKIHYYIHTEAKSKEIDGLLSCSDPKRFIAEEAYKD